MSEPRPARISFGLPLWAWVGGSLLLVLASLYGSLWLPELRERMAVRSLNALPDCQVEVLSGGFYDIPRGFSWLPEHAWLAWAHRLAPPAAYFHQVTIGPRFPLGELKRLRAIRRFDFFDATGTDLSDEHIPELRAFNALRLKGTKIGDTGLAQLAGAELRELSVADTRVGDEGIRSLGPHEGLAVLDLSGTRVGHNGIEALIRNTVHGVCAETLNLSRTTVGDADMPLLACLRELHYLDLSDTKITDEGLLSLANGVDMQLFGLYLDRTQVGDRGLRAILSDSDRPFFYYLSLSGTNVSWEYIETWRSSPGELGLAGLDIRDRAANWFVEHGRHCYQLDLSDTRFTHVGLAYLEQSENLRKLRIRNCAISESAALHFMGSVPKVRGNSWNEAPPPLADRIRAYRETGWLER
jgi:hypothetical protein